MSKKRRRPPPRAGARSSRPGAPKPPAGARPSRSASPVPPAGDRSAPPGGAAQTPKASTPSPQARSTRAPAPAPRLAVPPAEPAETVTGGGDRGWLLALAAVTLLAACLRLVALAAVPDTPFYDAAVRSMTLSWHNFFYGAFDPGASAAIDKPPFDLWVQVLAVKLIGFSSVVLKLPSALAASAAVPVLYDLVRRLAGRTAGLASALTLAVVPISVVTSRSDTMDSLMMALLVADAWLLVRYAERRELRWLLAAAVVLGIDFNVKLFEALIPVPAFLVFYWMSSHGDEPGRKFRRLAAAAGVFTVLALCWLTAVSLTPRHDRPYPIGSTNGSVWNAVFVYNGSARLTQAPHPVTFDAAAPTTTTPTKPVKATTGVAKAGRPHRHRAKAQVSAAPAGPLRLFRRSLVDFGGLVGTVLFAAIVLGVLGLLGSPTRLVRPRLDAPRDERIARAAVVGLGVWLLTGLLLFSFSGRVQPRYLEAFSPAVAATLGVSVAVVARRVRDRSAAYVLVGCLGLCLLETLAVIGPGTLDRAGLAVGILVGLAGGGLLIRDLSRAEQPDRSTAPRPGRPGASGSRWSRPLVIAGFSLAVVLAFPLARDVNLVRDHSGVQAASPEFAPRLASALAVYLRAHQDGARYEFAATAPSIAAPLIVKDHRPILLLTTVDARPLVTLAGLRAAIAARQVSYVVMHGRCPRPPYHVLPACSAAAKWVEANGSDVTAALGDPATTSGVLFRVG
jgi:4-amino-4-deoxy-L-arabinose transferase-like glycosyltransferase